MTRARYRPALPGPGTSRSGRQSSDEPDQAPITCTPGPGTPSGDACPCCTGGRLAERELLTAPVAVERPYEFAVGGGCEPRNAVWDEQSAPHQAPVDRLCGARLQLAVEEAVFRIDDPTQLDQLFTIHDILAT
ncbi:hypothetical protein ACFWIQ_38325 [Kitasatospora sp. NPDC127059]|uniref:hypothetical protein n=1 Tax=unclassified Kitasatospora TaxID=2633591 RepID=UPI0036698891